MTAVLSRASSIVGLLTVKGDDVGYETACCGTCRFWFKRPRQTAMLDEPNVGDCRWGPASMTLHVIGGNMVPLVGYPMVKDDTPACSQYELRLTEAQNGRCSEPIAIG